MLPPVAGQVNPNAALQRFSEAALRWSTGCCSFLCYSDRFGLSARFFIRLFALDEGGCATGAW
jgi:hypothetical protein